MDFWLTAEAVRTKFKRMYFIVLVKTKTEEAAQKRACRYFKKKKNR